MKKNKKGIFVCMLLIAATALPVVGSANDDVDWWPMFHHDSQLTGFSTSPAPGTKNILWTSEKEDFFGMSSPTIVDDRLFMSNGMFLFADFLGENRNSFYNGEQSVFEYVREKRQSLQYNGGKLYCLNTDNGDEIWNYSSDDMLSQYPAVYDDKVYIASLGDFELNGNISCLNADDGTPVWEVPIATPYTSPNVVDDKLYISAIEQIEFDIYGKMLCLDASDGDEIWNYSIGLGEYSIFSVASVNDDKVFFSTMDETEGTGRVICLNASDGDFIWDCPISAVFELMPIPIISNGKVYILDVLFDWYNYTIETKLLCLDAEGGNEIWDYQMSEGEYGMFTTPALAYGNVYATIIDEAAMAGKIYCIDAENGDLVWDKTTPDEAFAYSSPAIADEKLYIGSLYIEDMNMTGMINCFDAFDGTRIWSYVSEDEETLFNSPAIADEKMFVGCTDLATGGMIYAFEDEITINISGGIANAKATIENAGNASVSDIDWSISVTGGILGMINITATGHIDTLDSGASAIARALPVLGLGSIQITATATIPNLGRIRTTKEGFVLVFIVFVP